MKTFAKVFGLLSLLGAIVAAAAHADSGPLGAMRVRLVEGDVQVKIAETGEWAPVAVNTPLLEGDELWVPDGSRAALQTSNGAYVRLGGNTAFEILRMDRDAFQFHLSGGQAYVLSRAAGRSVLQFDTPDASVRAFRSATFRIDIPDGETDVAVFAGSIVAESDAGATNVQSGDMLVLAPGGYAELSPLPEPDDWEIWNRELDRIVLARGDSARYLPPELEVYSTDFDDNGRWVYVQDYGYCWTPTVLVVRDWAPYRHGRWCWRGGDYVWIGYEPWGWTPYHYGRWAFVARVGWCWVPPERGNVYWGPGYVGWVRTPQYVAWVPLAPRETYYGYGNYGRYSVNITNVNVTNVRVTNVYRNVNVTNSITIVNQTTFVTGRPGTVSRNTVAAARDDFARRRNVVVGRPAIKPVETSYAPVVRGIPEAKRPPAAVRKIDLQGLRQARPLVRESNRSAIRPEAKPRPLEVRKIETPRSVNERIRERRESAPPERRGPGAPQAGTPARVEKGGKPGQPIPAQPGRPAGTPRGPSERVERGGGRPQAPPQERVGPALPPARVAPPPGRIERGGGKPPEAGPAEERRRLETAPAPAGRGQGAEQRPQPQPQERVRPETPARPQPQPQERVRPETPARPQPPPQERVRPETPARPQQPPQERVKPEEPADRTIERERPEQPQDRQDRGTERRGGR